MHDPVCVRFFRAQLPHDVAVYILDRPGLVIYWINEKLITPLGAWLLELAVNVEADGWTRIEEPEPVPTLISVAS